MVQFQPTITVEDSFSLGCVGCGSVLRIQEEKPRSFLKSKDINKFAMEADHCNRENNNTVIVRQSHGRGDGGHIFVFHSRHPKHPALQDEIITNAAAD